MKHKNEPLEALKDIRNLMQESSKFLSLSGLSGVFAGVYALAGAFLGHHFIAQYLRTMQEADSNAYTQEHTDPYLSLLVKLILISGVVLLLSITTAFIMSSRKARKRNQSIFDHTSKKLLWSMVVPLVAGGVFCVALIINNTAAMVSPVMLLFYGLALVNSSKYTMTDIRYLGYLQILLGLMSSFSPGHGLIFWAAGFGLLHIIYGSIVWFKYDRLS